MTKNVNTRTRALGAAACVVGLVGVTACGGSSVEAYCDVWEDLQDEFASLDEGDFEDFNEIFDQLESGLGDAVDAAPDDIESQTENMRDAIAAINDLDIDFSDPAVLMDPELESEMEEVEQQFSTIDQDADAIEEYVTENCEDVNLG
ncbi:hypothetical protein [Nesterenkonia muleiensis]|uniref:hypothetical protein n=1 Tax=Nesterenkonia muleiensis TaxID=2282648 RepID=UPI000E727A6E|nr:hypothetical protein [Nesterenkonia muleiensis]